MGESNHKVIVQPDLYGGQSCHDCGMELLNGDAQDHVCPPGVEMQRKVYRHFVWKFESKEDADLFDRFRLLLLTKSCSVELKLMDVVRKFVKNNKIGFIIVLESTAMELLAAEDLDVTRPTLKKYRDKGVLVDENGKSFWYTDGHAIGYNYELLRNFVAMRKEAGVEPLVP